MESGSFDQALTALSQLKEAFFGSPKPKRTRGHSVHREESTKPSTPAPVSDEHLFDPADVPPVPQLQRALVEAVEGRATEAEMKIAELAFDLSRKHCHFCGTLAVKQDVAIPAWPMTVPWETIKLCICLDGFRTYQEFCTGWQDRLPELVAKLQEGALDGHAPVYSNRCDCGTQFTVNVHTVVKSVLAHGAHAVMSKCYPCHQKAAARRKKLSGKAAKPTQKPKKQQKLATLGEIVAAASGGSQ